MEMPLHFHGTSRLQNPQFPINGCRSIILFQNHFYFTSIQLKSQTPLSKCPFLSIPKPSNSPQTKLPQPGPSQNLLNPSKIQRIYPENCQGRTSTILRREASEIHILGVAVGVCLRWALRIFRRSQSRRCSCRFRFN